MRNFGVALFAVAVLTGCSARGWPGPVPIDEALWEVDVQSCGPNETTTIQWADGTVTNTGEEVSAFYQTASRATFTDGSTGERDTGTLIPPLDPGQSFDFRFFLGNSTGKEVATCEVFVVDSVSNYTN